eukprot:g12638.t1
MSWALVMFHVLLLATGWLSLVTLKAEYCGERPTELDSRWQPYLLNTSGISLIADKPLLILELRLENWYYNNNFALPAFCRALPDVYSSPSGPCFTHYSAQIDYVRHCNFTLRDNPNDPTTWFWAGYVEVTSYVLVPFIGGTRERLLHRPLAFTIILAKKMTLTTTITVSPHHCCDSSDNCFGFPCGVPPGLAPESARRCLCDACAQGCHCQYDLCPPTLTCPAHQTIVLTGNQTLWEARLELLSTPPALPVAIDNFDSRGQTSVLTRVLGGYEPRDVTAGDDLLQLHFRLGFTQVTYSATDAAGNIARCTFCVRVVDAGPPLFLHCPGNLRTRNPPSLPTLRAWDAVDNTTAVRITLLQVNADVLLDNNIEEEEEPEGPRLPPLLLPGETYMLVFAATDRTGNQALCVINLTLNTTQEPDRIAPTFGGGVCPNPTHNATLVGQTHIYNFWFALSATDNITPEHQLLWHDETGLNRSHWLAANESVPLALGIHFFSFSVQDAAGNRAVCNFTVRVQDRTPPNLLCPTDIETRLINSTNNSVPVFYLPARAWDNSLGSVYINYSHPSGYWFPLGRTLVTVTAYDDAGNIASCTFAVIVQPVYPTLHVDAVLQVVQVLILSDNPKVAGSESFGANVIYKTGVTIPYLLDLRDFALHSPLDQIVSLEHLPLRKECDDEYCIQDWLMKLKFPSCEYQHTIYRLQHVAHCQPADCKLGSFNFEVKLDFVAENYCLQALRPVLVFGNLTTHRPPEVLAFQLAYLQAQAEGTALPATPDASGVFGGGETVAVIVRVGSPDVILRQVSLLSAWREEFADVTRQNLTGRTSLLADRKLIYADSAADGFQDCAFFEYAEHALVLGVPARYVSLTAVVEISYRLRADDARGRRRRRAALQVLRWDDDAQATEGEAMSEMRRRMAEAQAGQEIRDTASAGSSLLVEAGHKVAATTAPKRAAVVEAWQWLTLLAIWTMGSLLCLVVGCICFYCGWRRRKNKAKAQGDLVGLEQEDATEAETARLHGADAARLAALRRGSPRHSRLVPHLSPFHSGPQTSMSQLSNLGL